MSELSEFRTIDSDGIRLFPHTDDFRTCFSRDIDKPITVNSEISNGIIYIHDLFPEKNKEQKWNLLNCLNKAR